MKNNRTKLLDQDYLQAEFPEFTIETHVSLPSTQDHLRSKLDTLNKPTVCLAEQQTAGRGQYVNRQWASPFAANIYLSYLYFSHKKLHKLEGLSLVVGLAIVQVIKELGLEVKIKWPNDVFCHDKKLAGILVEAFNDKEAGSKVIIGIGLNVNMSKDETQQITQAWTSLSNESGKHYDRNLIVTALMTRLHSDLQRFEQEGLPGFMAHWQQSDWLYNKKLTVQFGSEQICGLAKGINEQGHLLLELESGEIREFVSGQISIKNNRASV
ncbi:MAG: birA [Gammaproteobacteria bacterium]|jgi:BirA family biotin operon repressor/biotin-[acetyl-CoA-carboxylase] ligase|nr:birA [Gammaproteobacteria bacterium]